MTFLILGLVLFLGVHSVRVVAEPWRTSVRARAGEGPWKLGYTVLSLAGLALLVWGYGQARLSPTILWQPPIWTRHLAGLLTLLAFVLIAASQVPGNAIKARLRHPMVLGVKVWALAHLLANGTVASTVLFGSFLVWAVLSFRAARQRDRAAGTGYGAGRAGPTALVIGGGVVAWAVFAFWAHGVLIGVRPFG
jgi:uncharacterized membrane protein